MLSGQALEHFNIEIGIATLVQGIATYKNILGIVNKYVRLIDRSGLYPEYTVDQAEVVSVIDHLNEQINTLPVVVSCSLEDLYPDFDDPETDAYRYLAALMMEIGSVERQIEQCSDDEKESYQRLLEVLRECASALSSAGIG